MPERLLTLQEDRSEGGGVGQWRGSALVPVDANGRRGCVTTALLEISSGGGWDDGPTSGVWNRDQCGFAVCRCELRSAKGRQSHESSCGWLAGLAFWVALAGEVLACRTNHSLGLRHAAHATACGPDSMQPGKQGAPEGKHSPLGAGPCGGRWGEGRAGADLSDGTVPPESWICQNTRGTTAALS